MVSPSENLPAARHGRPALKSRCVVQKIVIYLASTSVALLVKVCPHSQDLLERSESCYFPPDLRQNPFSDSMLFAGVSSERL
jgi:hypothetical protein